MAKIVILGNNPQNWWVEDIKGAEFIDVPNISVGRNIDISNYLCTIPKDVECVVIDADSLDPSNIELPLDLALNIRIMLYECRKTSLSHIILVSELGIDTYKGYGVKSMVLMSDKITLVRGEYVQAEVEHAKPMTPAEYVAGFLDLIKIEPQEKVEGRHSIANEWGAEALYNVISGGVKSSIISIKASSSLYFKYSSVVSLNAEEVGLIANGKISEYLTEKVFIPEKVRYLLIDDEAEKGWDKVLNYLMPNSEQEVWSYPINSYEDLSVDIKDKIRYGHYDLIFLDLRMAGISEENIFKPEEFSGMKILKGIKNVNEGIQVIMLTATNKAWNVKALLDAGANGYYMKESPEYHFSLKYSQQNALALVNTIKSCIDDAYLQKVISQKNELVLPSDSELSDVIYNQLSTSLSLILKAKTDSEYAFAYISLEQVFEIASSYLIRQKYRGTTVDYFFTEDTEEQCRLYENGIPRGYLTSSKRQNLALCHKVAAIYYQLYGGEDKTFGDRVKKLISLRNQYIHPGNHSRREITSHDYVVLFETVIEFLTLFK